MIEPKLRRSILAGVLGALIGVSGGATAVFGMGATVAHRFAAARSQPALEATHLPPLLTTPGEPVELRYDVYCADSATGDEAEPDCDADGTAFVRAGVAGPFEPLPLRIDPSAEEGRYVAVVPRDIAQAGAGFSYYAVFRSGANGTETTLPAGGADASQRSVPLNRIVDVQLAEHTFGRTHEADDRVVEASWGEATENVGLEPGRGLSPIGATSFDVDRAGNISLLDEAHKRVLRWQSGARIPSPVPLAINGTLADMSISDDGAMYVLESTVTLDGRTMLRAFGPDGSAKGAVETAERATQVRMGPNGPVLLEQPSGQWMKATANGRLLDAPAQKTSGTAGRPVPENGEVVVLRRANEIRVSTLAALGVRRSWRVTSATPIAEVQLAEPRGTELVLVARLYTDDEDEFVVLVFGPKGLVSSFSLDSADWAETAALSRFRLVGSRLYRLGSTSAGVFVDRFDLEVG